MPDFANDLKELFDIVMFDRLEAYWVLPDLKSIERSDEDENAIDIFEILLATVDVVPISLIKTAEELRASEPARFQDTLLSGLSSVGYGFFPTDATEFIDVVNQTVQRDLAGT
jgi:hypothetical protein